MRIDSATLELDSIPRGSNAYGIAVGDDGVWVTTGPQDGCNSENSAVVLIDAQRRQELVRAEVGCAFALAAAPGGLVVAGTDDTPSTIVMLRWLG